jgi:hypothetical protein
VSCHLVPSLTATAFLGTCPNELLGRAVRDEHIAFEVSYGSTNSGIGNVTANTGLVEMAMAYSRSRVICAAARLGVADALGDEVCSVGFMAECQAHANALYCLLRALASIGVT